MTVRFDNSILVSSPPIDRLSIRIFLVCFLAIAIDGYDMQIIGAAASDIRETMHLQPTTLGLVIMSGQVGLLVGAVALGAVADWMGRKRLMILSCAIFGVFTLLAALAETAAELMVLRAIAGIGMGGIGPAVLAYCTEHAPDRFKASVPSWIWGAGIPIGGALAGLSAIWLLPICGWQTLFAVAGVATLATAILLWVALPDDVKSRADLDSSSPTVDARQTAQPNPHQQVSRAGVIDLFRDGRGIGTALLWMMFFLIYGILVFFVSWVPTLIKTSTGSTTALGASLAFFNIGSFLATIVVGRLIDRYGYYFVLTPLFLLIGLSMAAIDLTLEAPLWMLLCTIMALGGFSGSAVAGLMALAANAYPHQIRSTGIGAAYGIGGRLGALAAPVAGGVLIQADWATGQIAVLLGVIMVLGSLAMVLLNRQPMFRESLRSSCNR